MIGIPPELFGHIANLSRTIIRNSTHFSYDFKGSEVWYRDRAVTVYKYMLIGNGQ